LLRHPTNSPFKAFQKKDNQKERIERGVWVLALIVSVGSKIVTLILFIAAILPFWLSYLLHEQELLKAFSELYPSPSQIYSRDGAL
jgi:hypothetical protein